MHRWTKKNCNSRIFSQAVIFRGFSLKSISLLEEQRSIRIHAQNITDVYTVVAKFKRFSLLWKYSGVNWAFRRGNKYSLCSVLERFWRNFIDADFFTNYATSSWYIFSHITFTVRRYTLNCTRVKSRYSKLTMQNCRFHPSIHRSFIKLHLCKTYSYFQIALYKHYKEH
jgi:hypothetical protein